MKEALIGFLGVLLGILLGEMLRRYSRIENYSAKVFEKRLDIYEALLVRLRLAAESVREMMDNEHLSKAERHQIVSAAVLDIAEFCDEHELYISEELTVHCVSFLMGTEDIGDIADPQERERLKNNFGQDLLLAKRMLRQEAGLTKMDKVFRSVMKPKYSGPIVDYYRDMKKKRGIRGKW